MAFDPNTSPLLTSLDVASSPSYELGGSSNIIGSSTLNTGFVWGGPGGTFQIITTGNLAQIAQLTTRGLVAINVPGTSVVSALITEGTGIGVTEVGNDFQVAVIPSTTVQYINGQYDSTPTGSPRDTVNIIAGTNASVSLVDSGTSLDWTINASGGASVDGPFVITEADSDLTGATNLGALTTGFLYSTVTTGVSALSTVTSIPAATIAGTAVVLSGTQTITGVKTFTPKQVFTSSIQIPAGASVGTVLTSDASGNASWSAAGAGDAILAATQSFTGVNTFTQPPVMSGASISSGTIPVASVVGTAVALSGTQTITAVKTFTPQQVFTNSVQIPLGAVSGYVLTSDGSGNASWVANGNGDVTLAGAQTFTGVKTFTPQQIFTNSIQIPLGAASGKLLSSDGSGNATWVTAPVGDVTLAGTNAFTGTNSFDTNLPTSSQTPTTGAQLTTKTYTDATFVALTGAQTVAGVKTFSSGPIMSGASISTGTIPIASVVGTAMDLTTAQTAAGVKTFSSAPVMSGASITSATIPIASVVGTAVALSGTQTITAVKTFTPQQIFTNSIQIPLGAVSGYVLTSDASGNMTLAANAGPFTNATVSTTDATPTTLATAAIASNTAVTFSGTVVGRNTSGSINNACGGRFNVVAVNTAGTVALAATQDVTVQSTGSATFNVVVSGTNLIVQVTGIAATNYNWSASYTTLAL